MADLLIAQELNENFIAATAHDEASSLVERAALGSQRKADLTLDELVHAAQNAWNRFRDAQLYAFFYAAPVLIWARENETDFVTYCKRNSIIGDKHETRVVELMLAADADGEDSERQPTIKRERRAEFAACIGWFANRELCPETDSGKAVALARQKGRMTGIAKEFRDKKDTENPKLKAAKRKGQATKARSTASAALAREIVEKDVQEPDESKPSIISPRRPADHPRCEAGGDAEAMLEFLNRHGIGPGVQRELDENGEDDIYIYLRVLNPKSRKFIWYGAAADPDFANNTADLIVRETKLRSGKIAEAA